MADRQGYPPFNWHATCPKCRGDEVAAAYHADTNFRNGCSTRCRGWRWGGGEHIQRRCHRCGFHWVEASLDASDKASSNHVAEDNQ